MLIHNVRGINCNNLLFYILFHLTPPRHQQGDGH